MIYILYSAVEKRARVSVGRYMTAGQSVSQSVLVLVQVGCWIDTLLAHWTEHFFRSIDSNETLSVVRPGQTKWETLKRTAKWKPNLHVVANEIVGDRLLLTEGRTGIHDDWLYLYNIGGIRWAIVVQSGM